MFMPHEFELTETLERKLKKLKTKNRVLLTACRKKILEIVQNPYHYKHLRHEDRLRVHVGGSFVLTYRVFEDKKLVVFLDIEHHDDVYRR